jgi:hypothetical protein
MEEHLTEWGLHVGIALMGMAVVIPFGVIRTVSGNPWLGIGPKVTG